ncbi:pseudouridine synthase [Aestuariivirga litoralis]|uniref:pseudouridine synthase n=1 Tax=Aestuariivirga litoralis TaxID=2650924 RepID=UPI0018C75CC0|nr:pseudouridine synthase [Aestuariivirga litoralis]MBG1230961.1 rRNA pseudouridine synthase [Aestuariivirga litoralis]
MRLNVFLQQAGVGSRREAERLVEQGRIKVNGALAVATTPVEEGDQVTFDGAAISPAKRDLPRVFLLNKPLDVLVTTRDHKGRAMVFDLPAFQKPGLPRLMTVGRLDVNSEGLLVLSDDGGLAQAMMSPANALERHYRVRIRGRFDARQLAELARGVTIDGLRYRGAQFEEEEDKGGRSNSWYRVVLTEGKNREIRRLVQHFGGVVNRLIRTKYGPFDLGDLESGEMREVPPRAVTRLIETLASKSGAETP